MSHIVYMDEIPTAFQNAHSHIWEVKQRKALELKDQVDGWKELHNVKIFGGCFNKDENGKYMSINTSAGAKYRPKPNFALDFNDEVWYTIFVGERNKRMSNRRVRVNSIYSYSPVLFDVLNPPVNGLGEGAIVRVINVHGAPKANTMGMCYVGSVSAGKFIGMVCTNSLAPVPSKRKAR